MITRAFTLVELLTVVAIIAVLSGLLFPVLSRAKKSAFSVVSASNLHQCYIAASLYSEDNGGWEALPVDAAKANVLGSAPTCDPLDNWRPSCAVAGAPPLVGSYAYGGYVYGTPVDTFTWQSALDLPTASFMIDVFVTDPTLPRVVGLLSVGPAAVPQPTKALHLRMDGSVKVIHHATTSGSVNLAFSWPALFVLNGS